MQAYLGGQDPAINSAFVEGSTEESNMVVCPMTQALSLSYSFLPSPAPPEVGACMADAFCFLLTTK